MERRFAYLLPIILVFMATALILPGCLTMIGSSQQQFSNAYMKDVKYDASAYDESKLENCTLGNCWCMVCRNNTPIFPGLKDFVGQYCYFDKNCTQDKFNQYNNGTFKDLSLRSYGLGQGLTFTDFAQANRYCSMKMNMAVQWLIGTDTTPYKIPDTGRAICLISKNILPVYVLYSNHTSSATIDTKTPYTIANSLFTSGNNYTQGRLSKGPVGPVVITTEIDFSVSDAPAIVEQIKAINRGCQNERNSLTDPTATDKIYCFVAVAPKINDYAALKAVMDTPGIKDQVDLVAFGINGRYVHTCDPYRIKEQVMNFSKYALYTYQKPTIIPYVMFEPSGTDVDNSCEWGGEAAVRAAYNTVFWDGVTSLNKLGVIGIAPYSFNSTTIRPGNPLNCEDCALGKNNGRIASWFGGCQKYTNISGKIQSTGETKDHPSPTTMLSFSNASGGYCDFNSNPDFFRGIVYGGDVQNDITSPQTPALSDPYPTSVIQCDACLMRSSKTAPFPSMGGGGAPRSLYIESTGDTVDACTSYPEINLWAEQRDLDPMLVRAFILTESGFDPCKYAVVKAPSTSSGPSTQKCPVPWPCFEAASATYSAGYDFMDYAGACTGAIPNPIRHDPAIDENPPTKTPAYRFLGLGLTGSLEPPYTFWPAKFRVDNTDGPYAKYLLDVLSPTSTDNEFFGRNRGLISDRVLAMARDCNPDNFNPFNVSDSLCMGTLKLKKALDNARGKVKQFHANGWLDWSNDYDKDAALAGYLAANAYVGGWGTDAACGGGKDGADCAAIWYHDSWTHDAAYCAQQGASSVYCENGKPIGCYGMNDFPAVVTCFHSRGVLPDGAGGIDKMRAFFGLLNGCENARCPEGPLLYHDLTNKYPAGDIYAPPVAVSSQQTNPQ